LPAVKPETQPTAVHRPINHERVRAGTSDSGALAADISKLNLKWHAAIIYQ